MAGRPERLGWRDSWLDLVLGSRCVGCGLSGRLLCPTCSAGLPTTAVPVRPDPCPPGLAAAHAAGEYADPLRRMILWHKEHGAFALAAPLGRLLAAPVRAGLDPRGRTLLVPVPSRPGVVRARGHDPVLRMTRVAAVQLRRTGVDTAVAGALRQRAPVADQAGLSAAERAANLADRMEVRPGWLRAMARTGVRLSVVVCDDVLTTGATAREAQRALEDVGVPVAAIACVAATRRRIPPGRTDPLPLCGDGG